MFKSPFSFDGRIRRLEYGLTFIIYLAVYFTILAISASGTIGGISLILLIPLVWFVWAQGAKRCHDVGRSGWWQLIPFYFFVLLFEDGDRQKNEYGSNPKYPEEVDVLESETLDGHMKN
ncbi:MAG TPA: DUF805 domain-containing protein [Chryseosolibacter sp.]